MNPERRAVMADAWERIRSSTLESSPALAQHFSEMRARDWRAVPPVERQVLLAAAHLRVDPMIPANRRRLRSLVLDRAAQEDVGVVSEDAPPFPEDSSSLKPSWLRSVGSVAFAKSLTEAAGPTAALACVRQSARGISAGASSRFLSMIGYPAFQADAARVRWMRRFGLIDTKSDARRAAADAVAVASDLAASLAVPLAEFDAVIGAFSGATGGGGTCVAKPRCGECPVNDSCPVPAMAKLAGMDDREAVSTTLAESMLPEDRPREKLLARGPDNLTDAELLAILLRTGSGGENALRLATRLIREFGSIDRIAGASASELARKKGVGPVKAATIKAALEMARRLDKSDPREGEPIMGAAQVFPILRKRYLGAKREEFVALLLNTRNVLFRIVSISEGTLSQSLVHPREAFAEAMRDSAAAIIFAHNHPSGDPTPSRDDEAITTRLVKAGEVMGVRVLDHVVIGKDAYYSFADAGRIRHQT